MPTLLDLENKRVVITAGAAGIGRTVAERFLEAGARVHICDTDQVSLQEAAATLPGLGTTVADVSDPEQVERVFAEAATTLGGLDILVNNAGVAGPVAPVEEISVEGWRTTLAVNLDGAFLCARQAVPFLKAAGGGSIVNMSSTAGLFGCARRSPYVASKWALIGFTKTLAMELGPHRIRVNAICPGSVEGERIERVLAAEAAAQGVSPESVRQDWQGAMSMRAFVAPDDIAAMILFVCSDAGSMVSGQALAVDGHTEGM